MQEMIEEEGNLELQKKRQDEANERKNAVEAYVYMLRNHLSDKLAQFVTESEQTSVSEKLNQTEVCHPQFALLHGAFGHLIGLFRSSLPGTHTTAVTTDLAAVVNSASGALFCTMVINLAYICSLTFTSLGSAPTCCVTISCTHTWSYP